MPSFKIRRQLLALNQIKLGTNGATASQLMHGTATITCASIVGDARVAGSVSVTNVTQADNVFVTPVASMPAGAVLYNACAVDGGIAASFMNTGSANISDSNDVTVSYLVIG